MKKSIITLALSLLTVISTVAATLTITWPANPASEGISSYNVYANTNSGAFALLANVSTTSFQITDPPQGIYGFKISALNIAGEGSQSSAGASVGLPSSPTGGTATASNTTITVSWSLNDASQQVTEYKVLINTNGSPFVLGQTVAAPPAIFSNLNPGVYGFRLTAINLAGESAESIAFTGPGLPSTPGAPAVTYAP